MTLGQILQRYSDGEFNYLSNAVFGFTAAIIVPDIMKTFQNDARQSEGLEIFGIFGPWTPQF